MVYKPLRAISNFLKGKHSLDLLLNTCFLIQQKAELENRMQIFRSIYPEDSLEEAKKSSLMHETLLFMIAGRVFLYIESSDIWSQYFCGDRERSVRRLSCIHLRNKKTPREIELFLVLSIFFSEFVYTEMGRKKTFCSWQLLFPGPYHRCAWPYREYNSDFFKNSSTVWSVWWGIHSAWYPAAAYGSFSHFEICLSDFILQPVTSEYMKG